MLLWRGAAAPASLGMDRNSLASWTVSDTRMGQPGRRKPLPDGSDQSSTSVLMLLRPGSSFPSEDGTLQLKGRLMHKSQGKQAESLVSGGLTEAREAGLWVVTGGQSPLETWTEWPARAEAWQGPESQGSILSSGKGLHLDFLSWAGWHRGMSDATTPL